MNTTMVQHVKNGSVLILALILLLILTVMVVSEMSVNNTQTRIATNTADAHVAFATAEAALNEATNNLLAGQYTAFAANTNGLYVFDFNNAPWWTTINWTAAGAVIQSFQGTSNTRSAYIIEQLPSVIKPGQNVSSPAQVYRITARAVGASGNSAVILQSNIQIQ